MGNAWADMWRITVYLLLPISIVYALFLSQQGVVQTFVAQIGVPGLTGVEQHIPLGPVASQEAIKMLVPMAAVTLTPIQHILLKIRQH